MNKKKLFRSLFQYRGSKDDVAHIIWERFGNDDCDCYIEPFMGKLGCLLQRNVKDGAKPKVEVVGDLNGYICNLFRAIKLEPDKLADRVDNQVLAEMDVLARDRWLRDHRQEIEKLLLSHPNAFSLDAAEWWLFYMSLLPDTSASRTARKHSIPNYSPGVFNICDKVPYLRALSDRLKNVRLIYGDWRRTIRACPPGKITAVFFDPPYGWDAGRRMSMYEHDEPHVAKDAARVAVLLGRQPGFRVCFAGLEGEHQFPPDWEVVAWQAPKARYENRSRERLWFSPGCLKPPGDVVNAPNPKNDTDGTAACLAV